MRYVEFVLHGVRGSLDAGMVTARLREVAQELVREHGVRIGGLSIR